MTRGDVFLNAVDLLRGGHCVEILGERGSGRSHLLRRVSTHFATLGWQVIELSGRKSVKDVNFTALDLAGLLNETAEHKSPFTDAFRALSRLVNRGQALFVIDDVEWADRASRSVVDAVSTKFGVPVLFTRSIRESMIETAGPMGSASAAFSLKLEPMSYVEMEVALSAVLDASIDTQMMSRIFAQAGGNIGLAVAIVVAAQHSGNIEVVRGVARATGELWSPLLIPLAKRMLQGLSPDSVSALQVLSLLGPAYLDTAELFVAPEQILLLEELSYLATTESLGGVSILVQHALLVAYFRNETKPARRFQIIRGFEAELADAHIAEAPVGLSISGDSALFVRMVHEKARLNTLRFREVWLREHSLPAATRLLVALVEDPTGSEEEVESLILGVEELEGSEVERAEWEIELSLYRGYAEGGMPAAVARLDRAAQEYPGSAVALLAQASLQRSGFEPLPEKEPFVEVDLAGLDRETRLMVVLARSFWLVVRGRAREADELLHEYVLGSRLDSRLVGLVIYTKLALDQSAVANEIIQTRFAEATATLDSRGIRTFAFMGAVKENLTRSTGGTDQILEAVSALGLPPGVAPATYIGLATLSACAAIKKGHSSVVRQNLADIDSSGYKDGHLPGMQRALIYAQIEATAGNLAAASLIYRENGDLLWAHGARFAAANSYLEAMQLKPDAEAWAGISVKLKELDSPLIERLSSFVDALVRSDLEAILAFAQSSGAEERTQFAQIALTALHAGGVNPGSAGTAFESLKQIAATGGVQELVSSVQLSARERQVAELISSGLSNPRIADVLVLSIRTVESHVNRLMKKLGANNRDEIRAYFRTAVD